MDTPHVQWVAHPYTPGQAEAVLAGPDEVERTIQRHLDASGRCLEPVPQRLRFGEAAAEAAAAAPDWREGNRRVVEIKTKGEIDAIREAGRVVAETLDSVRAHASAGTRLSELDDVARAVLARAGARSPFLGYKPAFAPVPFPAVICASVNDAALHGIPGRRRLAAGDLVSIDCGAILDGWVADAAISFTVGPPGADDERLIGAASAALRAGIGAAVAGARIGDISAVIGAVGRAAGYGINTDFGGHGVGRTMHEAPSVPNEGAPGRGMMLSPGLVVAIEPWFMAGGTDKYQIDDDGWTIRTADGSRAAHVEHTIAVTADGPVVLTAP